MVEQNNFQISTNNKIVKKKNKIKIDKTPKLSSENYHREEIHQNKIIVINAIWMTWIGIALIIASFIVYVLKITDSLVAGVISGCFIDVLSTIILHIFNKSNDNKQNYFNNLASNENEEKIIKLIESTENDDLRYKLINRLLDVRYANRR